MQLSGKKRLCFLLAFQHLALLSVVDKAVLEVAFIV